MISELSGSDGAVPVEKLTTLGLLVEPDGNLLLAVTRDGHAHFYRVSETEASTLALMINAILR